MIEYKLFTVPTCCKCKEVKEYLKKKGIDYEEINAGQPQFKQFYAKNKEKIKREENGGIALPIFLCKGEILQGIEKIINKF